MGQLLSTTDNEVELENEKSKESSDGGVATNLLSEKVFLHLSPLFFMTFWVLNGSMITRPIF